MKERRRHILHVDLDPFFVNVERSLDASLRGRAVIVGGGDASGLVAVASAEARQAGVVPGQAMAVARRLCPAAVVREGDFETYGRFSEEVSAILLAASRRVERPSADEAYVDLTPEHPGAAAPAVARSVSFFALVMLMRSFAIGCSSLTYEVVYTIWATSAHEQCVPDHSTPGRNVDRRAGVERPYLHQSPRG